MRYCIITSQEVGERISTKRIKDLQQEGAKLIEEYLSKPLFVTYLKDGTLLLIGMNSKEEPENSQAYDMYTQSFVFLPKPQVRGNALLFIPKGDKERSELYEFIFSQLMLSHREIPVSEVHQTT
jgi:hypothetical protein